MTKQTVKGCHDHRRHLFFFFFTPRSFSFPPITLAVIILTATAGSGDLELVELLISLGLSIADQSRNGWDVFLWGCLGGHAAVVSKLLSLGSNIGVKDKEGRLGLHWAAEKGHAEAVGVLVRDMLQANLDIQATVSSPGIPCPCNAVVRLHQAAYHAVPEPVITAVETMAVVCL